MASEHELRNSEITRAYLAATDAFDADAVERLLAPEAVQIEFPSEMNRARQERGRDDVLRGVKQAALFLRSQRSEITGVVASGDQVAVEAVWTGVLAGPMGPLNEGDSLRIYVAHFFTLQGDQVARQQTYYCVEPPPM